jgi:hypothetical protein
MPRCACTLAGSYCGALLMTGARGVFDAGQRASQAKVAVLQGDPLLRCDALLAQATRDEDTRARCRGSHATNRNV